MKEQIKFLEEEIRSMEESELGFSTYTDWYGATNKNLKNVITKTDVIDKTAMEKKMQKLEVQHICSRNIIVINFISSYV